MIIRVQGILTGCVAPLGDRGVPSGINKTVVTGPLWLGCNGFAGDEQGDRRYHGGPDKAVHHYPADHYRHWRRELGENPAFCPGGFGENLTTVGLDEGMVAVGDTFRLGTAVIAVSQGRQPCFKLNIRFGAASMARQVQTTGRSGWYYRVIEPGKVTAGDSLILLDRPNPKWTVCRLWRAFYVDPLNQEELEGIAALTDLPESWRTLASRRLASNTVEDWSRRLGESGGTE